MSCKLAIFISKYKLDNQLVRTVISLLPEFQGISKVDFELHIVDNDEAGKYELEIDSMLENNLRIVWHKARKSGMPIHHLLNHCVAHTNSTYIGLLIDGARLCSPRLIQQVLSYLERFKNSIVYTPNYQLGPKLQMYSHEDGYSLAKEESLLKSIDWPNTSSEELIKISTIEPHAGIEAPFFESNGLFLSRDIWNSIGGYDERFMRPDGGFASADLFERATSTSKQLIVLQAHGTFHQLHFGATTNNPEKTRKAVKEMTIEYRRIRQRPPRLYRGTYMKVTKDGFNIIDNPIQNQ